MFFMFSVMSFPFFLFINLFDFGNKKIIGFFKCFFLSYRNVLVRNVDKSMSNARKISALFCYYYSTSNNWKIAVYTYKTPSVSVTNFTCDCNAADSTSWFWLFIWEINVYSQSLYALPLSLDYVIVNILWSLT